MDRIVGIGEYVISNKLSDIIKTFALSSCVAVTAYCPFKKAAGMIHIALPVPFNERDIRSRPGHFASTGIPMLIDSMVRAYGCKTKCLRIGVYGGADSISRNDLFTIGKRNIEIVKNIVDELSLNICSVEVGGTQSRTLEMSVETGMVKITTNPIKI